MTGRGHGRTWRWAAEAAKIAVVAGCYYGAARFGLSLAYENSSITAVWAPTGIALAALVLWGARMWPGVVLGAFLANAFSGADLGVASVLGITAGNTLEAVIGAYLLRAARFRPSLDRVRDVLALAILAGGLSTMVSATIGVASLNAAGVLDAGAAASAWRLWWLGDMGGDLIVAPVIFVVCTGLRSVRGRKILEAVLLLGALAALCVAAFSQGAPIAYLIFPLLVVAALRFGQQGAAIASLLVAAIAISATAAGSGPFARTLPDTSLLLSQTFVAAGAVMALVLAALTTERTGAQHELERARDELQVLVRQRTAELETRGQQLSAAQEIDRAKDELLALVSHDLRTPLTSIRGYSQLLLDGAGQLDARGRGYVEVIDRNSGRLLNLVEDLLVVAQHQMGAFTVRGTEIDLAEVARETLIALQPVAAAKDVTIVSRVAGPIPTVGDRDRLNRMLDNLIGNAIKYTHEGGAVEVEVERCRDGARLCVRDNGPGIQLEDQQHIFDRFARARDAVEGGARGFGLGLTIARAIAEGHGGRIGVDSVAGRGATFWVELPLRMSATLLHDDQPGVTRRSPARTTHDNQFTQPPTKPGRSASPAHGTPNNPEAVQTGP